MNIAFQLITNTKQNTCTKYSNLYVSNRQKNNVIAFGCASYLDRLDNLSHDEAFEYLTSITSDEQKSKGFIEEITANPRESRKITNKLVQSLGSKENFDKWYFASNGYFQAFNNYSVNFFNKAKSVEELVKFMPNWGDWRLSEKSRQLSGNEDYTIGALPEEFGSKSTYQQLSRRIKETYYTDNKTYFENIDGKDFHISYPQNGLSGKIVATINDKYILKTSYNKKYKADSPYLNAAVDYYLNANNSKNACKMYYYDDKEHSILYEKSTLPECKYEFLGQPHFYSPHTIFNEFEDAKLLGITFTDRGTSNYRTDGVNNISIDSGHSEYVDVLKPGFTGYHITLPSNTGFSMNAFNGVVSEITKENKIK